MPSSNFHTTKVEGIVEIAAFLTDSQVSNAKMVEEGQVRERIFFLKFSSAKNHIAESKMLFESRDEDLVIHSTSKWDHKLFKRA